MRTQEIREMEKRAEMYRKLLIWNIVFLLGLLCWGSVMGQSGEYHVRKSLKEQISGIEFKFSLNDSAIGIIRNGIGGTIKITNYTVEFDTLKEIEFSPFIDNSWLNAFKLNRNYSYYLGFTTLDSFKIKDTSAMNSSRRAAVVKVDSLGIIKWTKKFGNDRGVIASVRQIVELENEDIILLLNLNFNDTNTLKIMIDSNSNLSDTIYGGTDIWVVKLDKNGSKIWDKSFGGVLTDEGISVHLKNSNIQVFSNSGYNIRTGTRIFELDSNGNKIFDTIVNYYILKTIQNNKSIISSYLVDSSQIFKVNIIKIDSSYNIVWDKHVRTVNINSLGLNPSYYPFDLSFEKNSKGNLMSIIPYYMHSNDVNNVEFIKINELGNTTWSQRMNTVSGWNRILNQDQDYFVFLKDRIYFQTLFQLRNEIPSDGEFVMLSNRNKRIHGSAFPDFNSNCTFNKSTEYSIPKIAIHNKTKNTYAITNDSIYTMYLFDSDTAVLKIINLDSNLYVSCGKDSIVVDMTGKTDTSGINFPIRSNKTGHCINITSFSSGLLRPGRWGDYQLNYQNNAFDTAYNAYIEIEVDTAAIDSIISPYSFTLTGNVLRFNLGHVRPFGFSSVTYSIKLKTTVIIGSSHCHRAKVFPICNLYPSAVYDSSEIQPMMRCLPNDTVEFTLKNIGIRDQKDWGHSIIYVDELILKKDSFKLTVGNSRVFKYKLDTNKVFTAEVFNSNFHPVTPILIRHNDLCANRRPMIPQNAALNFSRHDEAKEYEEACTIVRGSYDPNIKSVQPVGMFSQHYTATGTELKYRLDFQNTGTDTAFRVVLIDTLSVDLDIASFVPGASSHPFSVEFGGRAVKFIFDPIALVASFKNEPLSHGYVCFKIKHKKGIAPKTKIENFVDIYFDYNAPVRTNTVFNTIFDTIQIYIPKAADTLADTTGKVGIQGLNKTSIMVFPNPTTDKFYLSMSEPVKNLSIEIYDMQGRLTKSLVSINSQTLEVSAEGMTKGIYHIRVLSGEKLLVVKKIQVE